MEQRTEQVVVELTKDEKLLILDAAAELEVLPDVWIRDFMVGHAESVIAIRDKYTVEKRPRIFYRLPE